MTSTELPPHIRENLSTLRTTIAAELDTARTALAAAVAAQADRAELERLDRERFLEIQTAIQAAAGTGTMPGRIARAVQEAAPARRGVSAVGLSEVVKNAASSVRDLEASLALLDRALQPPAPPGTVRPIAAPAAEGPDHDPLAAAAA